MSSIEVRGIEFKSAGEAIQHVNADGRGEAICVGNRYLVVEKAEAHRLEAERVSFAYVHEREMPDGSWRIVTVPVN